MIHVHRLVVFMVAACAVGVSWSVVAADRKSETVTCKVSGAIAKVGVYERTVVGVTIDESKKECSFSINGADVGSPPLERILQGLNSVISGSITEDLDRGNVNGLAYALLASSSETEVPLDLSVLLMNGKAALSDCLRGMKNRGQVPELLELRKSGQIACGVVRPRDRLPDSDVPVRAGSGTEISVRLLGPALVVGVARSSKTHYLVLPLSRAAQSVIPLPAR